MEVDVEKSEKPVRKALLKNDDFELVRVRDVGLLHFLSPNLVPNGNSCSFLTRSINDSMRLMRLDLHCRLNKSDIRCPERRKIHINR